MCVMSISNSCVHLRSCFKFNQVILIRSKFTGNGSPVYNLRKSCWSTALLPQAVPTFKNLHLNKVRAIILSYLINLLRT